MQLKRTKWVVTVALFLLFENRNKSWYDDTNAFSRKFCKRYSTELNWTTVKFRKFEKERHSEHFYFPSRQKEAYQMLERSAKWNSTGYMLSDPQSH